MLEVATTDAAMGSPPARSPAEGGTVSRRRPAFVSLIAILAATVCWPTACDERGRARPGAADAESIRIALVGQTRQSPAWPVLQAAAKKFSNSSVRIDVEAMAPESASPEEQERMLRQIANQPFQAVCVVPVDPLAMRAAVRDLVQRGKRIVTIGRDVPDSNRQAYCGPSQFELGAAAVRACTTALMGRSKSIILLHAGTEEGVYALRYVGFKRSLPMLRDAQLLRELDCGGNSLEAQRLVRAESHRYPRVGCWVMLDDWALRTASENERILPLGCGIVLCNGSPKYFARLRDGQILAMIAYDFRRAVDEALFAAMRVGDMAGKPEDGSFDCRVEIITIRELHAYEERWRQWQGEFGPTTAAASSQSATSSRPEEERAERP